MLTPVLGEDIGEKWLYWPWVSDHWSEIWERLQEHIELTVIAVLLGLAISLPLGLLAYRRRWLYPTSVGLGAVLYTIPSVAALGFLLPVFGLSMWTAVIPLASYTLLILVRNTVTGLDGVQPEVREAAEGMGYSARKKLFAVELPLALPAIFAGIRIATVTTIGLVPVTVLIGQGGLGRFMRDGFQRDFRTPLVVATILTVALAVVADLLLVLVQRLVTPWSHKAARA